MEIFPLNILLYCIQVELFDKCNQKVSIYSAILSKMLIYTYMKKYKSYIIKLQSVEYV